ncbi:N-acetylmuramoyl-L-alanine amidase [Christensenella minuta]|nr:N-acetylmuramoyl-L-alanine amidase [Christensenella minuta]
MSKIYINPGHGGADSGAVGIGGRQEKDDALRYASVVADKLKVAGHTVELERNADYLINVKGIAKNANLWGADLFIAFHRNAGGGDGAECLIVTGASATSREMAQAIQGALVGVGFRDRGVKVQDRNTYVLSHTTMPATTIECGFVDNAGDNALFDSKFNEIVQGIAAAILSIAGGVVPNTVTPPSPSANVPELNRVLKYGCKGGDVRMMQERLNAHKANVGKADGEFGDKTRRGLHAFQQARIHEGRDVGCRYNGNKPDGKCGELTWTILHEPAPGE